MGGLLFRTTPGGERAGAGNPSAVRQDRRRRGSALCARPRSVATEYRPSPSETATCCYRAPAERLSPDRPGTARTAAASSLGSGQRHIGPLFCFLPPTTADRRVGSGRPCSPPQPVPRCRATRPRSLPPPATRRPSRKLVSAGGAPDGRSSRICFGPGRR